MIYRIYGDADQLLYVGKTVNLDLRLAAHRRDKSWWGDAVEVVADRRFADCEEMAAAEILAIKAEGPLHNITHTGTKVLRRRAPRVRATSRTADLPAWQLAEAIATANGEWLRSKLAAV